mgnify:CR=1 FL=1
MDHPGSFAVRHLMYAGFGDERREDIVVVEEQEETGTDVDAFVRRVCS